MICEIKRKREKFACHRKIKSALPVRKPFKQEWGEANSSGVHVKVNLWALREISDMSVYKKMAGGNDDESSQHSAKTESQSTAKPLERSTYRIFL
jgi:hypothetical protein